MTIIKAGQHWHCINGHVIATFKRDIQSGDDTRTEDLDWRCEPPRKYQRVDDIKCQECGAKPRYTWTKKGGILPG